MKFIGRLALIALLGYFVPAYLPWWILFLISFLVCYAIPGGTFMAFISGFIGGGIVWLGLSYQLDAATSSILSEKMVQIMGLSDKTVLLIISGLVGALVSAFGAATGSSFRNIFRKKEQKSFYS